MLVSGLRGVFSCPVSEYRPRSHSSSGISEMWGRAIRLGDTVSAGVAISGRAAGETVGGGIRPEPVAGSSGGGHCTSRDDAEPLNSSFRQRSAHASFHIRARRVPVIFRGREIKAEASLRNLSIEIRFWRTVIRWPRWESTGRGRGFRDALRDAASFADGSRCSGCNRSSYCRSTPAA